MSHILLYVDASFESLDAVYKRNWRTLKGGEMECGRMDNNEELTFEGSSF